MKHLKHLFTSLLLLIATAVTAHNFEVGGIYYNITDATNKTVSVTYKGDYYNSYNEYTGSVVIPQSVIYNGSTYSVTSIGEWAFYRCSELTSITIPNSVTSIGNFAFCDCYGLTSITIPNSVTSIEGGVFSWCGGLTSITIPNSVKSIGEEAFAYSGLTSIEIPNSVTIIGNEAFKDCSRLTSIVVDGNNTKYDSRENCNAIIETKSNTLIAGCKNTIIPSSVTSIGDDAFDGCRGLTSITIPNSVTSIGNGAFSWCGFTSITIPNSVTSIGNEAFACTGLTNVVIGNSVTSIGGMAFYGCTGLTSITIPNSVTSIGNGAFQDCTGLTSIEIPNSVTSIGGSAFDGTAWYNNNPDGIVYIGKILYEYKGTMPSNTSITIKDGTLGIADYAFNDCTGLTSITIPNSVTSIGDDAFSGCTGLTSITIPNSVTSIGDDAFRDCTGLTSITIPNSVTSIGYEAFWDCTGLKTVYNFSNLTFSKGSTNNGYVAYYADKVYNAPSGSIEGDFIFGKPNDVNTLLYYLGNDAELTLPADYKSENYVIGTDVFKDNTTITSVEIPSSVTSIGDWAFLGCTGLKTVINFSNLTISQGSTNNGYVAYYADKVYNVPNGSVEDDFIFDRPNDINTLLYYLGNATELTLPADYKGENYAIGANVFKDNTNITSVVIPNSVTSIGEEAFNGCSSLKTVFNFSNLTFNKGTNSYGHVAYYADKVYNAPSGSIEGDFIFGKPNEVNTLLGYLGNDAELTLPANYKGEEYVIGNNAFTDCYGLTSVEIPGCVTSIGRNAFYGCTGLTSITIPGSVTSIGGSAFKDCTGLEEVHINDLTVWCGIIFSNNTANPLFYTSNLYLNGELLTELVVPDNITAIKNNAFIGCKGLTSVVIPNSVTSIERDAFNGCSALKTIFNFSNLTFSKGASSYGHVAYYATKVINAPNGSFEGDFIWCKLNGANTLACYLGEVAELILPDDYNGGNYVIGNDAFLGCTGLTSIEIPNSVTSVGDDAFTGCTNVEKLYLDCAEVGDWFSGVSAMKEVTIGNGVTSVVASAFNGCTGLEKVCINDLDAWCGIDFGSADANPLYYAGNLYLNGKLLTDISIPTEVEKVKDYAFYNCNGVTNIDIVDGVKSIGNSAFYGCCDLETLYISNTIESIDDYAFAECNNIFDIKIGSKKAITASENIFSSDAYNNACLYVPTGRKDFYAKTSPWSNFIIKEMDFTGIEELKSENGKVKTIYDLNGRAVENPSSGIYIINGKKVFVK